MEERIFIYLLKHPGAKAKDMAEFILGNRQDTRTIENYTVKSINHDEISTWKSNIISDYYVRKTTKRRFRRWRRW